MTASPCPRCGAGPEHFVREVRPAVGMVDVICSHCRHGEQIIPIKEVEKEVEEVVQDFKAARAAVDRFDYSLVR